VTEVRISFCNFTAANFFTALRAEVPRNRRDTEMGTQKVAAEKTLNRAAATPLFRFSTAQKVLGPLPPCGTESRAGCFYAVAETSNHRRRKTMSIIKKAPGIMTREVKLEVPVNELLEDYARFIESSTDHVLNATLKKVLWRDQDYRKWRAERRTEQPGTVKGQPIEARPKV
jgi:hypothetical protein